jgi:hypothetical protein
MATVEPTTKVGAVVVVAVLIGVDTGLEIVQQRRTAAAQTVLTQVNREERFLAARKTVLAAAQSE